MKPVLSRIQASTVIIGWIVCALAISAAPLYAQADSETIELFNGQNLEGWRGMWEPNQWITASHVSLGQVSKRRFAIEAGEGLLVNGLSGNTTNLFTEYEHGDCRLQLEFVVPHGSNSGVYFQGLYEIQILDSYGIAPENLTFQDCGAIYARYRDGQTFEGHPPRVNASNPPGVWQRYDIVFRAPRFNDEGEKVENARFIRVEHNGVVIHENVEVTGNTRASMNLPEAPLGPLMLQGDHGPVAYRNIRMTPLTLD